MQPFHTPTPPTLIYFRLGKLETHPPREPRPFTNPRVLMDLEKGVASVKFSGIEAGTSSEGDGSECEATRAMVVSQNRKKKKSGGFQSMGENLRCAIALY